MTRKNYTEIHLMRIFACLAVIIIHVTANPVVQLTIDTGISNFFIIINRLAKPSVPIFIFISGFLLFRPSEANNQRQYGKIYRKSIPHMLITYAIWSLVYYGIFALKGDYPISISFFLTHLLQGNIMYHLYFMIIIIQLYALFPILDQYLKRANSTFFIMSMMLLQMVMPLFNLPFSDRLFPTYIAYFALGMGVKKHYESDDTLAFLFKNKSFLYGFTALSAIIYIELYKLGISDSFHTSAFTGQFVYMCFSLLTCLSLLLGFNRLFKRYTPKNPKALALYSKATLPIYYAHPLAIQFSLYLMNHIGIYSLSLRALLSFVFVLVTVLPISIAFVNFQNFFTGRHLNKV